MHTMLSQNLLHEKVSNGTKSCNKSHIYLLQKQIFVIFRHKEYCFIVKSLINMDPFLFKNVLLQYLINGKRRHSFH